MKQYLTEQDLAGYLKKIDEATTKDVVDATYEPAGDGSGSFDSIPQNLKDKANKEADKMAKEFVDRTLTKAISITKTYKGVTLPEDLYDAYNKNLDGAKDKLITFVEKEDKEPEIEIEMKEDFSND